LVIKGGNKVNLLTSSKLNEDCQEKELFFSQSRSLIEDLRKKFHMFEETNISKLKFIKDLREKMKNLVN
jgi:hypothetical protein